MSNFIDSLQLSGTNYSLKDPNATNVTSVTQAEYDALVTGGTLDPTVMYIISDAQPVDISQYWTSAQTNSAINAAVSGKLDTSTFQTYSGSVDTALANKVETSAITTAVTTASTDSEIPTAKAVNDAIAAGGGGGGGTTYSAGTNISISNDTINCTLPISAHSNTTKGDILFGTNVGSVSDYNRLIIGRNIGTRENMSFGDSIGIGMGTANELYGAYSVGIGKDFKIGNGNLYGDFVYNCVAIGHGAKTRINAAVAIGYNAEASGTTKTNINNQLKIDTSNQIYIMDKTNTNEICLQDYLGGGGTVDQTVVSGSTNAVAGGGVYDQLGGMKIVHLTQAQYDQLQNKDNMTLYVITNS